MLTLKEQVLGGVGEDRGGRTGADRLDWEGKAASGRWESGLASPQAR